MHYVKIKTRIRIYMHDLTRDERTKVFKKLNTHKINYRYIASQTYVSLPLKDEPLAKYLIQLVSK